MKLVMIAASAAIVAVAGIGSASAQTYSNTIHQSAGDRDARGTPKYYQPARPTYRKHVRSNRAWRTTTGAAASGPTYSRSIHQSAGDRDSRGTPKYNQEKSGY